ncbi:6682_t:CDS:1, partial [Acaulospora morrowiae]
MVTLYGNDTDTDSIIPWKSMTQETATTSFTSIFSIEETDELNKYRHFWWKT